MKAGTHAVRYRHDIADDQRRNRVARILADYGNRAHESVFEIILDGGARYDSLQARLENAIDPTSDAIRLYRLRNACERARAWLGLGARTETKPSS